MESSQIKQQKDFYNKGIKLIATEKMQDTVRNFYFMNILSILSENKKIAAGSKILEVGVGTGILAEKINRHFPDCRVKGIDLSEKHIKIAHAKGLDVEVADIYNLHMSDKFDMIYGSSVIHHLDDLNSAFKSMAKVLNEGGVILFGAEPLHYHFFYIIYLKLRGIWEVEKGILNISKANLRKSLQDDFKNIKFYHAGNMFTYLFKPIGVAWNLSRLSRIPLFNDVYIYAEKK